MMTLERALALASNAEGWSREDILEAAKVLRDAVQPVKSAAEELSRTFSQETMLRRMDRYEKAKDQLLLQMADGIGVLLQQAHAFWPHSDGPEKMIQRISNAMENFRKALDKSE